MNENSLKLNWFGLLPESPASFQMKEAIFNNLVDAYSTPARQYHNLNHIWHLLALITEAKPIADLPTVIQLAAWFHDYVYAPQAKDNEIKSAIYAVKTLNKLNVASKTIESVKQIILSTQKHQPLIDTIDCSIFLDVDLAILGSSSDKYRRYAQGIRQEYSWLSDRHYQQGRKQVLANFLARERIYYTDYFYQKLERRAKANLKTEIELYD